VHTIVEAVYGDRTSFLDVTARVSAMVDEQRFAIDKVRINKHGYP
jgi:hypothetical protein